MSNQSKHYNGIKSRLFEILWCNTSALRAFTLAEVLITLAIIGVVAAMTIPALIQSNQEQQIVTGLKKFDSNLQQAIQLWKQDISCYSDAYTCLAQQNLSDGIDSNFDQIAKFLKVAQSTNTTSDRNWLPDDTLNYYGNSTTAYYGKVTKTLYGDVAFLLQDGTIFSNDINSNSFDITVDVNGKKPPNRIGKDTFNFVIGAKAKRDIYEYSNNTNLASTNDLGLCGTHSTCDPNNIDPTKSNGASPTAYVLLNGKLPDFKALSQSVSGMQP